MSALSTLPLLAVALPALTVVTTILLLAAVILFLVVKNMLYVCQPNEVLIFAGRSRSLPNGDRRGYRIIRGGRAIRIPFFETVDRMNLTNMIIDVEVTGAYSKGGIPLTVQGIANLKVPGEEPLLNNTLERFLGKSRDEIMKVARETLEGNLRGVLSTLTPEEVNMDKERFARQLSDEAEQDFNTLGLVLDTLKIQNVTDDVGYLASIGRQRSAEIRRDALIAEAQSQTDAKVKKWANYRNGEVSKFEAKTQIAIKENVRRVGDAQTQRAARIAQERAEVQALVAKANGELAMQDARIEQVRLQLDADVVKPAIAAQRQAQEAAKGQARQTIEQGKASAGAFLALGRAYKEAGNSARDVLLMQKLVPLTERISAAIGALHVDRLTVLGHSSGQGEGANGKVAGQLVELSEQVRAATGIDVNDVLSGLAAKATAQPRAEE